MGPQLLTVRPRHGPGPSQSELLVGRGVPSPGAKLDEKGFAVVPVDHSQNSHQRKAPGVILDVSMDSGSVLGNRLLGERRFSYLGRTLWFVTLAALSGGVEAIFDQCRHEGDRTASRQWLTECTDLLEL